MIAMKTLWDLKRIVLLMHAALFFFVRLKSVLKNYIKKYLQQQSITSLNELLLYACQQWFNPQPLLDSSATLN